MIPTDDPQQPGWGFAQCFGDKGGDLDDLTEADIISAVEFDYTGDYIATGDRGGRVVLFERNDSKHGGCEYRFLTEFQSHEPEFDYLKSLEIEEKINKIKWLRRQNAAHFLLSTNDKTIKLWKVYDKNVKVVSKCNVPDGQVPPPNWTTQDLKLPVLTHHDTIVAAVPRRVYANAHAYHINSISVNADGETFLSADDLRINLWNLDVADQSFTIVDTKPPNLEELTEVITSAEFSPSHCNLFAYSSSRGVIRLADMRSHALCDHPTKTFEDVTEPFARTFFSEIISSMSCCKFSPDGRYILSRDYMTLKLWDLHMERAPVAVLPVHPYLQSRLCDLYENDCIFDRFECGFSGTGRHVFTGSYANVLQVHDVKAAIAAGGSSPPEPLRLQADKALFKARKTAAAHHAMGRNGVPPPQAYHASAMVDASVSANLAVSDFQRKVLHASWHPTENTLAVAAANNLFLLSTL